MALRPIVTYPHKALTTPAQPVVTFDAALHTLLDDMAETMYASNGVGLAANQIDVLQRVYVIDTGGQDDPQLIEFINPEIIEKSGTITWDEGCLSFPELYEKVKRARHVTVRFQDRNGAVQQLDASDLLAVAIQHELDHIDGICFIDRMGPIKRKTALKEFQRIMQARRQEAREHAREQAAGQEQA